jgi:hypothetical protein
VAKRLTAPVISAFAALVVPWPSYQVSRSSVSAHCNGHIWAGSLGKHILRMAPLTGGPIGELAFPQRGQPPTRNTGRWIP